jgi:hypothetical protein
LHSLHISYNTLLPWRTASTEAHQLQNTASKIQKPTKTFPSLRFGGRGPPKRTGLKTPPPKIQKPTKTIASVGVGGERGIRTPGNLRFNGFQDRRIRPLCQLSGAKIVHQYIPKKFSERILIFICVNY